MSGFVIKHGVMCVTKTYSKQGHYLSNVLKIQNRQLSVKQLAQLAQFTPIYKG